jgi:hypothetical protein
MIKWTKYHSDDEFIDEQDYLVAFIRPSPIVPYMDYLVVYYDKEDARFRTNFPEVEDEELRPQEILYYVKLNTPHDRQLKIDFGGQENT